MRQHASKSDYIGPKEVQIGPSGPNDPSGSVWIKGDLEYGSKCTPSVRNNITLYKEKVYVFGICRAT